MGDEEQTTIPAQDPYGSHDFTLNSMPLDTSGLSGALGAPGASGSWLQSLIQAIGGPQAFGALLGTLGPTAGLLGNLASGGRGATQTGTTNQNQSGSGTTNQQSNSQTMGSQTGQTNTNQQQNSNQTGFSNGVTMPIMDPMAMAAGGRVNDMLMRNAGSAQGAYDSGLSMLEQLVRSQMTNGVGQPLSRPNTTPSPQAVTGFPQGLPSEYNAGLGNLIKQAMGSFVGDLGSQAITNARGRGFAGGADLLNTAAAPMMGQSLAQVPAMEAKAYLDHVLQEYALQTQNASAENAARAGALNAATNALGPGVSMYGIDKNAQTQQLGQTANLLQMLMNPQNALMQGNLSLLNSLPRGSASNTLTGGTGSQSLSGTTNTSGQNFSQTQSNQSGQTTNQQSNTGNTTGTTSTPMGNIIGQGLGNLFLGAGTGYAAADARQQQADQNASLLEWLRRTRGA